MRAHLHPRIVTDNRIIRAVMVVPAVVEKGEVVAAGNTRRPVMTPASTVVVTTTRPRTAANPSMGERPTWPKMKSRSLHCS
jgi:hypothetical protein